MYRKASFAASVLITCVGDQPRATHIYKAEARHYTSTSQLFGCKPKPRKVFCGSHDPTAGNALWLGHVLSLISLKFAVNLKGANNGHLLPTCWKLVSVINQKQLIYIYIHMYTYIYILWMDKILHHFETMRNHCLLVCAGESSFQGLLGGAGFCLSAVCTRLVTLSPPKSQPWGHIETTYIKSLDRMTKPLDRCSCWVILYVWESWYAPSI